MSDKNINQLFEAITPKNEQKEKMLHHILEQSTKESSRHRFTPVRRLRFALLAVVLMVCLTSTAFAAVTMGLDEAFKKFLNPVNHEQEEHLANGAYVVNKKVANKNGVLTIKQVIGDSNLTYILMDFTAPKGTVLDAARYRFQYPSIDALDFHSSGFMVLDDGNPNDNSISLVMSVMTKKSMAGQMARFQFTDLQAADPLPGEFETIIPDTWETAFKLDFKEYSTLYQVNQKINMYGYDAVLKSIAVSPISISLKVESETFKEINEAAGEFVEVGENEHLDNYPVTIKYKDGSSETTTIFNGMHSIEYGTGHMLTIKTFENVINDKEIASIVFFDKEIPIHN